MQEGRGGGNPFFNFGGHPFGGFGGFGGPPRSLLSNFFGGRDPFDDPFFTHPFGSMFESSLFGPSQIPFMDMHPTSTGFIEPQAPEPKRPRGLIIEELNSDDEKEKDGSGVKENPRKHGRSDAGPYVEVPDDEAEQSERRNRHLQYMNGYNSSYQGQQQPQTRSFTFQSSTVSYGGADGAYYTSSKTRRTGSDGVTFEESKEADTASGQASHRISRGLHDKGHSVMRKLNSDGRVDTMQTLHNLNEDELAGFEESWNGKAQMHLPGLSGNFIGHNRIGTGSSGQNRQAGQNGWALPSTEHSQSKGRLILDGGDRTGPSRSQHSVRMKGSTDFEDQSSHTRGKQKDKCRTD